MDEIEDFLNVEAVEAPEAEPTEAVETPEPEKAEQPRGPDGKFLPKGESEPEVVSPTTEEPNLDHPALIGERRRRQDAEQKLAALEAQLQQQPPQPTPDMFENPEGWQNQFGQSVVSTAVQQATLNAKLDMSEMMVRQANPDFEEMKATFLDLAKDNPTLAQQALGDPHPWNKAYQIAKTHMTMQEVGATDVASLRAALEAKIRAELQAQAPAPPIPETLADAQSARGSSASPVPAVLSLDDILRR